MRAGERCSSRGAARMVLLAILMLVESSVAAQGSVPLEYRNKASFLVTFPRFIDWPDEAFAAATAPFFVCVTGDFQFGTYLAESARTVAVHGRRIEVRWVRKDQELKRCHILFVSRSEAKRYGRILQMVQGADVLTIGETSDFLNAGGVLSFSFENEDLQFEVNLVAANEAHLRVSSKLLAVARRVMNVSESAKS